MPSPLRPAFSTIGVLSAVLLWSTPTIATQCDNLTNIAPEGQARQSSNWTDNKFPARYAIDGKLSNYTHTAKNEAGASWRLRLQEDAFIQTIELYNRQDCCGSRLRDIKVSLLDADNKPIFTSALLNPENQLKSPARLKVQLPALPAAHSVLVERIADPDLSGSKGVGGPSEPNVLSLAEVRIWACDNPPLDNDGDGVNDAQDAFPQDPSESADSDNDGIGDNADPLPTVANRAPTIALPSAQNHSQYANVSLKIAAQDADGDKLRYQAQGLPDGLSIDPNTGLITGTVKRAGNFSTRILVSDPVSSTRLSFNWSVEAPAPANCGISRNIAREGTAKQSSNWSNNAYPASNAIDGSKQNFTHTAATQKNANWELMFEQNAVISELVLHNRQSCCGSRLRDIRVNIFNSAGEQAFKSALLNTEDYLNGPQTLRVKLPSPVRGNRVSITRKPDPDLSGNQGLGGPSEANVLSLAEVEVLACQDQLAPLSVKLYGDTSSPDDIVDIALSFSEKIVSLNASALVISNGELVSLQGEGRHFRVKIRAYQTGRVELSLPADVVVSEQGASTNLASDVFSVSATVADDAAWVIEGQESWLAARSQSEHININKGRVQTSKQGSFKSVLKRFDEPRSLSTVIFEQVADWSNWKAVSNVGPRNGRDAPVLLSLADNNYYFLALGSSGGYHAWHSRDMQNWHEKGPVTPPGKGRWVTSAEYKDGLFYIYADAPNDLRPHLFVDDNLDDGIVGVSMGDVFTKAACGSDASFFRNDSDGLFHMIYEDWSPINARSASWDSPLAGHTSSVDGITGFEHHEHLPPVDHRTQPTGVIKHYEHPNYRCSYEEHSPAQDAFGDWTTIKIGSQYYMFADYDQHDAGIKVARFTSDSIYGRFDLVGSLGKGHPDPTVGFAEGQFYLITQQQTDYVSSGPWVSGLEARAGVDTNDDGVIDQWSNWQTLNERYQHKAGYARVVEKVPASLNVDSLPEGYGFQFEFKLRNPNDTNARPILKRVDVHF